jgi:hypothetical protein
VSGGVSNNREAGSDRRQPLLSVIETLGDGVGDYRRAGSEPRKRTLRFLTSDMFADTAGAAGVRLRGPRRMTGEGCVAGLIDRLRANFAETLATL